MGYLPDLGVSESQVATAATELNCAEFDDDLRFFSTTSSECGTAIPSYVFFEYFGMRLKIGHWKSW